MIVLRDGAAAQGMIYAQGTGVELCNSIHESARRNFKANDHSQPHGPHAGILLSRK
jgi:hypothetical protein